MIVGDPLKQTKVSISYLMNDVEDTFESFALRVLSYLLTDGQAAPFYKALIESNIGSDYVASTGYDTTTKDATFSIGLQGIRKEDIPLVSCYFHFCQKSKVNCRCGQPSIRFKKRFARYSKKRTPRDSRRSESSRRSTRLSWASSMYVHGEGVAWGWWWF